MFRDLKEYQELQKLYVEKVSKPENVNEFFGPFKKKEKKNLKSNIYNDKGGSSFSQAIKGGEKLNANKKDNNKNGNGTKTDSGNGTKTNNGADKKRDTSSEIEDSRKGFDANDGKKFNQRFKDKNTDTSSEIESDANYAKSNKNMNKINKFGKSSVPKLVKSPMEAGMGDGADKARAIAKARIKSGKTIADVKAANTQSMKDRARARNDAFKKRQQEFRDKKNKVDSTEVKKLGKKQPKVLSPMDMRNESYEPYDIVLEYLLSSQQAATIEEANYIMTEMDAKTIQDIVEGEYIPGGRGGNTGDVNKEPGLLRTYRNVRTLGNLTSNIVKSTVDKDAFKKGEKAEINRYKNPKGVERIVTGIADKLTKDKYDFDRRGPSKKS